MKLYKRLLSLLLVCFVCFGLFSVNAYAVEESENLVDSEVRNWDYISYTDSTYANLYIQGSSSQFFRTVGWNTTYGTNVLDGAVIYNLTNLTVGENYSLNFSCYPSYSLINGVVEYYIGIGYYDANTGELEDYEDNFLVFNGDEFGSKEDFNVTGYTNIDYYKDFEINFTYNEKLGTPCVFIQWVVLNPPSTATSFFMSFVKDTFSLTRQPSETEKKLDGILGWLQDIKNSIVGLPETIKTNFQTFFSDLENKINDFKNTVTEKFTNLSNEFNSYITNLGNNIKGFFEDFWNNISEWFEKFKPRIEIPLTFNNYNGYHESDFFIPYSDKFHLQLPFDWYLDIYDLHGNKVNFVGVSANFNYQFLKPYYTEYYQFRIRIYGTGFTEPSSIYVDDGWLSAVFDGFKYQFYSLKIKIDLKIEEIKQNLHDLFIPSEGYFDDLSNRFDLLIEERFGALVTITDYLVEFFSSFNADVTKEYFDVPIININLLGYNFPIGGWQVRFVPQFNGVEILTNACKFISSVLATFAFFDGLKNKYHEVFGGGE